MAERANQENGTKTICLYELAAELHQSDPFNHFVRYRMDDNSYRGVVRGGDKVALVRRLKDRTDVYIGNLRDRSLRHYQGNGKVLSLIEEVEDFNAIIDLDERGRRWEGGAKDGQPFGYGTFYNEDNRKEYEGFACDGKKMCWGIDYYDDIEKEKFRGFFLFNMRYGCGVSQDRNEDMEYNGNYIDENPVHRKGKRIITSSNKKLVVKDCRNTKMLCLEYWQQCLESIHIYGASLTQLYVFSLKNLPKLKVLDIDNYCCSPSKRDKKEDTWFVINSCPSLESISIGSYSFQNYSSFKLKNLPSLKSLTIGSYCFCGKTHHGTRNRGSVCAEAYYSRKKPQIACRSIVFMSSYIFTSSNKTFQSWNQYQLTVSPFTLIPPRSAASWLWIVVHSCELIARSPLFD